MVGDSPCQTCIGIVRRRNLAGDEAVSCLGESAGLRAARHQMASERGAAILALGGVCARGRSAIRLGFQGDLEGSPANRFWTYEAAVVSAGHSSPLEHSIFFCTVPAPLTPRAFASTRLGKSASKMSWITRRRAPVSPDVLHTQEKVDYGLGPIFTSALENDGYRFGRHLRVPHIGVCLH